jgi:hypothetical protein
VASLLVLPAVLAAGVAVALGSCDSSDEPTEVLLLDWKRGTYEGVRLGDHSAKLQRVLGRPEQRGRNESFEPIGEDFYDIGGLTNFGSPDIGAVGDYAGADCFTQNEGTEYVKYPFCKVRVCAGRLLGFGGDPIKSLWLAAETRTGLRRCRPPR